MVQSDLDLLLSMGFEPERAALAVKKTGGRMSSGFPLPNAIVSLTPQCSSKRPDLARGKREYPHRTAQRLCRTISRFVITLGTRW